MEFKNLIEIYKKVLNEKVNEDSSVKYNLYEDSFIEMVYMARQKNIDSLIRTLEISSRDFKVLGYRKRYNSERLFIELYNTFKDKK